MPKGRNTILAHLKHLRDHNEMDFNIDQKEVNEAPNAGFGSINMSSELKQWPVQLHLLNPQASYFRDTDVVLTADCVPFAMANFHARFLKGKSLAIACPKLDTNKESYIEKLASMISDSRINSLSVIMMEVPCCGGLLAMAETARQQAGRNVPIKRTIVGIKGDVLEEDWA